MKAESSGNGYIGEIKCYLCDLPLVVKKTTFFYLDLSFNNEVPCCPQCGNVFISMELAQGRMAEVERQLEDK